MRLQNSCRRGSISKHTVCSPQLAQLKEKKFLGLKVITKVLKHRKVW